MRIVYLFLIIVTSNAFGQAGPPPHLRLPLLLVGMQIMVLELARLVRLKFLWMELKRIILKLLMKILI